LELGEPVYFATGKSDIEPDSEPTLESLAQYLDETQDISLLRIEGHTDNVGMPSSNLYLSGWRARAVRDWLVEHGIDSDRLIAVGFGDTRSIATNSTEEGRAKNRRTEFVIVQVRGQRPRGRADGGGTVFE